MTSLVDCPHCSTRVLPMAGRVCPACRRNVDAPPTPEATRERVIEAGYDFAAHQMRNGAAPSGIAKGLTERGLNAEAAATVVSNLEQVRARAYQVAGRMNMLYGVLWCIGGIVVTAMTYLMAASAGGGKYVFAWGAILYGAIRFVRGLIQSAER